MSWQLGGGGGAIDSALTKLGFATYEDTATSSNPIVLVADTWTKLTNNGLGVRTDETYLPSGVDSMYNLTDNVFIADNVTPGVNITIKAVIKVTPTVNNSTFDIRLVTNVLAGETVVDTTAEPFGSQQFTKGAGVEYDLAEVKPFGLPDVASLGLRVETEVQVRSTATADVVVDLFYIGVS